MAVSIPREVFTLGAVQFDASRLANLEGQLLAKREAKQKAEDEAFDKYFSEKQKIYQEKGVRPIDQKSFLDRVQKWRDFSIANKSEIAKNPLIRSQADNLYAEAFNFAQNSSRAEDKLKPYDAMLLDKDKRREMNIEMVMESVDKHKKALDDPDRQDIETNDAWFNPPIYDFNKDFREAAQGQQKAFLRKIPGSTDYQLGKLKVEIGYLPNSIKQIATDFATSVAANPQKLDYWKRQADKAMPAGEVVRLNELLKPYFPNLEVRSDNPIALAMAKAIEKAESVRDVEMATDEELEQKRAMERSAARATQEEQVQGNAFDEIDFQGMVRGAQLATDFTGTIPTKGENLPQSVRSALSSIGYNIGSQKEVEIKMKDGKVIEIRAKGNSPVSRNTMMNAQLKFSTEPLKGQQMTFGQPTKTKAKKGELD